MKRKIKSRVFAVMPAIACLMGLAACEDVHLPRIFGGSEVPEDVMEAPRAVSTPPVDRVQTWPRLGDVPSRPKNFPRPETVNEQVEEMEAYREESGVEEDE